MTTPSPSPTPTKPVWRAQVPLLTEICFTQEAWDLYSYLCDKAKGEVSCLFVRGSSEHPHVITDLIIPKQVCTAAHTSMNMESVAELTNAYMDEHNLQPWQVLWCWGHTHPQGMGATPSGTDEETFRRDMGSSTHAFMIILSKSGQKSCRVRMRDFHFAIQVDLPISIIKIPHPRFPSLDSILAERVSEPTYTPSHNHSLYTGDGDDSRFFGEGLETNPGLEQAPSPGSTTPVAASPTAAKSLAAEISGRQRATNLLSATTDESSNDSGDGPLERRLATIKSQYPALYRLADDFIAASIQNKPKWLRNLSRQFNNLNLDERTRVQACINFLAEHRNLTFPKNITP